MAWNKPIETNVVEKKANKGKRLLALLALVLVGCGVFYYCSVSSGTGNSRDDDAVSGLSAENGGAATCQTASNDSAAGDNSATNQTEVIDGDTLEGIAKVDPEEEKIISVETNKAGYIIINAVKANGEKVVHVDTPPPIFEHQTDELILFALTAKPGKLLPPLPNLGGRKADIAFMKSLEDPILDKPEDSAKVRAYKDLVRQGREYIRKELENGAHFYDLIADHCKTMNENAVLRAKAQRELKEYIKNGDVEGARLYYKTINKHFEKMGVPSMKLSKENQHIAK